MTPPEFVAKWSEIQQKETAVAQSHFNDVCQLVGHLAPPPGNAIDVTYAEMVQNRTLTNLYNGLVHFRETNVRATYVGATRRVAPTFQQSEFDKVTRRSVSRAEIKELDDIHTALDHVVLDAYGWPHQLTDEEILERLLALNLQRAGP